MLLYRLSPKKYQTRTDGEGAKRVGGRWSPKGFAVHHTSTTAGLAVLESLVHFDPEDIPPSVLVTYRIPDHMVTVYTASLPKNWRNVPPPPALSTIGKQWLESNFSLALRVPSVLFPNGPDANVLVNPMHPEISHLTIILNEPFAFDPRLFRK